MPEGQGNHHHHHHEHHHEPGDTADNTKTKALLEYMAEHNRSHAGELAELAHKLYHGGQHAAADLLSGGVKDFEEGNRKLARALELIKGGQA